MKVAIVTGGSRGIGAAIVRRFVDDGYFVYFTYSTNSNSAEKVLADIPSDRARALCCDLNDHDSIDMLANEVLSGSDQIDVLVNNAGITKDNYFALMTEDDFELPVRTNLFGTMRVTRKFVRKMVSQKSGVVINIASVSGFLCPAGQSNYAAAKAGIIAFTKSLGRELGKYNIRVVGIAPGFINTEMYARIPMQMKKKQLESVALGRSGNPEEIAGTVNFLASDDAAYITCTTVVADGGLA